MIGRIPAVLARFVTVGALLSASACGSPAPPMSCDPSPCEDPDRVCVIDDATGLAECRCPAGTDEIAGECVTTTECTDATCAEHGECFVEDGVALCDCDEGFGGPRCDACAEGFHDDGTGGCTDDPCTPSPCEADRRCAAAGGVAECRCPFGQHDEGGVCVPDTTCMPETCGHGECAEVGGGVECTCDEGYRGAYCDACDESLGYHDDGMGGCTTDPCLPSPCSGANRGVCDIDASGAPICLCDAGYHEDPAGACVPDETCAPDSCNGHGVCDDSTGAIVCACDAGWALPDCASCAATHHDDGMGGCTTDLCLPNPCTAANRTVCVLESGGASTRCECDPGYHEDAAGGCAADEVCAPTSCNGHGTCDDASGIVVCTCVTGWAGDHCGSCDAAMGYHADGMGGCTTDPCTPNPCVGANRGVCTAAGTSHTCGCDPGYHDDGGLCVPDETCTATSCNGHGSCDDSTGVIVCTCATGWAGTYCGSCDASTGHHPDGMGGCTTDPCTPNPCTAPFESVCTAAGATPVCSCDPGYHDDGVGNCTDDPCLPDPCPSGQLCREVGGAADCYVPTCDDGNPCSDDTFDGASCVFTTRPDGAACSTTLCTTAQQCTGGVCGGGIPTSCDDGNPCTADTCHAVGGCSHAVDDTLVPDDGVDCTIDACSGGAASHTIDHSECDDGSWCTGTETCAPTSPSADARGCVTAGVPAPPSPDGPCGRWVCDDASTSFSLDVEPTGAACNDRIACTTGDACDGAGHCVGTITGDCGAGGACTSGPSSPFDVVGAAIRGSITYGGGALPHSLASSTVHLVLQNQATGAYHTVEYLDFGSWNGSEYPLLGSTNPYYDHVFDSTILPGVYDVIYRRYGGSDPFSHSGNAPGDPYPYGNAVIQEDVVIGPGVNTLDVDIPAAQITGAITYGGGALPDSLASSTVHIVLRNQSTGAYHTVEYLDFGSWNGSAYPLLGSTNPYYDHTFDSTIVPGTYDVIYRRFGGSDPFSHSGNAPGDPYPYGNAVIQSGVVIAPGANTLNVDIPAAMITGAITYGGGALPDSLASSTVHIVLRNQSTGAYHTVEYLDFGSWDGSAYPLLSSTNPYYDHTFDSTIVPGTYDVIYRRYGGSDPFDHSGNAPGDPYPYGNAVIRSGVVIAPGANTLNVDIPAAMITGAITYGGGALPDSLASSTVHIVLRNQSTGAYHTVEYLDFGSWDGSAYPLLGSTNPYYDHAFDSTIVPGTYDVIYRRYGGSDPFDHSGNAPGDPYPYGNAVIQSGVVITPGANTLNVDVPAAMITGAITYDGGALPDSLAPSTVHIVLQNRSTGAYHTLEYLDFGSWSGTAYPLLSSTNPYYDHVFDSTIVPGTYDVIYRRYGGSDPFNHSGNAPGDPYPYGNGVIRSGVVITPGANTLNVAVPSTVVTGAITYDGGALPDSLASSTVHFVLRDRTTGAYHTFEYLDFGSWNGSAYPLLGSTNPYYDHVLETTILPGTYDVIYRRFGGSNPFDHSGNAPGDAYPYGNGPTAQCVAIP